MKTGIFREEGWKAEVNILEDNSDKIWEKYKLEVVKTLRESRFLNTPPDGHIMDVSAKREYRRYVHWQLEIKG